MTDTIWDGEDEVRVLAKALNAARSSILTAVDEALFVLAEDDIWQGNQAARRAHAIAVTDKAFAALLVHQCLPLPLRRLDVLMDLPEGVCN